MFFTVYFFYNSLFQTNLTLKHYDIIAIVRVLTLCSTLYKLYCTKASSSLPNTVCVSVVQLNHSDVLLSLQCFDTVGWVTGTASGLYEVGC